MLAAATFLGAAAAGAALERQMPMYYVVACMMFIQDYDIAGPYQTEADARAAAHRLGYCDGSYRVEVR